MIESPCINKCQLNPNNICIGCYRTISEITGWTTKSINEQKEIVARSLKRKNQQSIN